MTAPDPPAPGGRSAAAPVDEERVVEIQAGPYRASVSEVGAALVTLTYEDRPLVYQQPALVPEPRFRGAVLAPWPNRIRDGRYRFDGEEHQLPLTEPHRATSLHGLVVYHAWTLAERSAISVAFETGVWPQPGYPFPLSLRVEYELSPDAGLRIRLQTHNRGSTVAPFGASIHPYLSAGEGAVDDWTFHVGADRVVAVDERRLLPTGTEPVDGTPFDFRFPSSLEGRIVDHALTGLRFDEDGCAQATLRGSEGRGVRMRWQRACGWLQVHTTDLPGQRSHRRGLAVEPMTCPPDAFNSGEGLLRLEPGDTHEASWWISAV